MSEALVTKGLHVLGRCSGASSKTCKLCGLATLEFTLPGSRSWAEQTRRVPQTRYKAAGRLPNSEVWLQCLLSRRAESNY